MNKYHPNLFIDTATKVPIDTLTITDTDTHVSESIGLGINGFASALFAIANAADQSVAITVYGKNDPDDAWRIVLAATTIAATNVGTIHITRPWAEIRLSIVYSVAPASGALRADCILSPAVGMDEAAASGDVVITDIEGFDTVKGQATEAESLPVVPPSDGEYNAAAVVTGAVGDAAVTTGIVGTISAKLRGILTFIATRMPAALGQALMNAGFPVTVASDQSAVYVRQRGASIRVATTVVAEAYDANDGISNVVEEIPNAARSAGEGGWITDIIFIDDSGNDDPREVWVFDRTFTPGNNNAEWVAAEDDLHNLVGIFSTGDGTWRETGTPSVCHLKEMNVRFQCLATSLFFRQVTRGTPTFAAVDDSHIIFKVAQDD